MSTEASAIGDARCSVFDVQLLPAYANDKFVKAKFPSTKNISAHAKHELLQFSIC